MLGLQKTRLLDPTLNFLGTNDHPGDYRSSGCTACHIIYANDRSVVDSGPYAKYGNKGLSFSKDPTIPKDESGHPIDHRFAPGNGVPTSQCVVCHMHPGTNVVQTYLGMMWWDEETDGKPHLSAGRQASDGGGIHPVHAGKSERIGRPRQPVRTGVSAITCAIEQSHQAYAIRRLPRPRLGLPAVFRQDRHGRFLDHDGHIIEHVGNAELQAAMRFQDEKPKDGKYEPGVPVHLMDIHLEKGMHCIDCHFVQDVHGNNRIQDEVRAGCEIQCVDCHGTVSQCVMLRTSGVASYTSSPEGGRNLAAIHAGRQTPIRVRRR